MSLHARIKRHKVYMTSQIMNSFKVRRRQFSGDVFSRQVLRFFTNQGVLKKTYGMFKGGQVKCIWELNK